MAENRVAAVLGFFDGMHLGHDAVLRSAHTEAAKRGITVAAFTFAGEPDLPKFAGRRDNLIMSFDDKIEALKAHGVSDITAADFEALRDSSPESFFNDVVVGTMRAECVLCGRNFRFGKGGAGDVKLLSELCAGRGISLVTAPTSRDGGEPVSSSRIRELIRAGDVDSADRLLGHELYYTLPVLRGKQLGRTIGFPTANQDIPPYMVRPKRGVYLSRVSVNGTGYPAITNIGVKPTVKSDDAENMETHIIGFDGDLYGKTIRVYLRRFLREERRFDSLTELKVQLEADKAASLGEPLTQS